MVSLLKKNTTLGVEQLPPCTPWTFNAWGRLTDQKRIWLTTKHNNQQSGRSYLTFLLKHRSSIHADLSTLTIWSRDTCF